MRSGSQLSTVAAAEERRAVAAIEELGYTTLWFGEGPTGKEALTHAAVLLSASRRLMIATGIANIYGRDATAAASGANTLSEAWQSRFVLGLGVSHLPLVSRRGHDYGKPVSTMRAYLDAMDATPYGAPLPEPVPRVLAALRPKMLELAATRAHGAHPYFVTPEHTHRARATLGPDPVLAPEQAVVVDTDSERARATARGYAAPYLRLPNYVNNVRELGFSDADFEDGGSDALIDAVVPWGDPETLGEHIRAHYRGRCRPCRRAAHRADTRPATTGPAPTGPGPGQLTVGQVAIVRDHVCRTANVVITAAWSEGQSLSSTSGNGRGDPLVRAVESSTSRPLPA